MTETRKEYGICVECGEDGEQEMRIICEKPLLMEWCCPNCGTENFFDGRLY